MPVAGRSSCDGHVSIDPSVEALLEYSRALVAAVPDAAVLVVEADRRIAVAEGAVLNRAGRRPEELLGRRLEEILPPDRRTTLVARYEAAMAGEQQSFDRRMIGGRPCRIQLTPMYLGAPTPVAITVVIRDLTPRRHMAHELRSERARRQAAEELVGLGHWEIDLETGSVTLSEGAMRLLGADGEPEWELTRLLERVDPDVRAELVAALAEPDIRRMAEYECNLHALDGRRRRVLFRATYQVTGGRATVSGTAVDITRLREAERARVESETLFRQGFDGSPIGMAVADVTGRYVRVNDALCRLVGRERDELLGMSFQDITHPSDHADDDRGRTEMDCGRVAHLEREKRYVRPDGTGIWVSVHTSPVFRTDGTLGAYFSQVVDLTARKEREEQLRRDASDLERLAMIRSALDDDRLVLHAQPIIDLTSGALVQQELLLRLRTEEGELLAPGEFLAVAERYGTIRQIDQWVIQRAAELAATGAPVEVNLSAASVGDADTLCTIGEALERTGADPSLVVFEVTETALMADLDRGRAFAEAVRRLGCRFALDDFGTGYGTFTYLKHLPIDYLKIDIEFVRDLLVSDDDERLVRTIVAMARDFSKITIAEGVEDAATLERLRALGVDHAQGYHIGRPAEIALPSRGRPALTVAP